MIHLIIIFKFFFPIVQFFLKTIKIIFSINHFRFKGFNLDFNLNNRMVCEF